MWSLYVKVNVKFLQRQNYKQRLHIPFKDLIEIRYLSDLEEDTIDNLTRREGSPSTLPPGGMWLEGLRERLLTPDDGMLDMDTD